MSNTTNEVMTEDEKTRFLESYRRVKARRDRLYDEMLAKGYVDDWYSGWKDNAEGITKDEDREEDLFKCAEWLSDFGMELGQAAAHVESYGLEFVEENGEVYLRDIPPEWVAEQEAEHRRAWEREQAVPVDEIG